MIEFRGGNPVWREDIAVWRQIATELRQRIRDGQYPPRFRLTEAAIAQEFGVARNTVRKSFEWLRQQDLLYTRDKLGSFVGPEPVDDDAG